MKNLFKKTIKRISPLVVSLGIGYNVYSQDNFSIDSLDRIKEIISLNQIAREEMDSLKLGLYDLDKNGQRDSISVKKYKKNGVEEISEYEFVLRGDSFKVNGPRITINGLPRKPYPYDKNMLRNAPREILIKCNNLTLDGEYTINKKGKVIRFTK